MPTRKGPLDISAEKERAADLVSESRLYRQTAAHTGDTAVAGVLDDIDRVLLEIAHGPSRLAPEDSKNCANGWRPKAYFSRSVFWARTSGTRKNPPRTLRRPPGAKNYKRLNL